VIFPTSVIAPSIRVGFQDGKSLAIREFPAFFSSFDRPLIFPGEWRLFS
jgi:hypothetical protein